MAAKKFRPPAQGMLESKSAYDKRVTKAEKAFKANPTGDKRNLRGNDRTPAQKRGDQARDEKKRGEKRGPQEATGRRVGYGSSSGTGRAGQAHAKKRYQITRCSKCGGMGIITTGVINRKTKTCTRCGGRGEAWEKV